MSETDIERIVRDAREQFEKLPPEADISPTAWNDAITASECRTFWIARRAAELARDAERERCAKIAEGWCDPQTKSVGCHASYNEGLMCSATEGITAAIRAGKEVESE